MKIKRFMGKDMRDALNQVKAELGGDAVIMSNKKVVDGVEIVAAYDKLPESKASKSQAAPLPVTNTPSLSEIIGDSGPDSLKALLEKQANKQNAPQTEPVVEAPATKLNPDPVTPVVSNEIGELRKELQSLRNVLQFQVSGLLEQDKERRHPLQGYLCARLQAMGVSNTLSNEMVSYTPNHYDERQAWLFLLKLLANRLNIAGNDILNQNGVVALVGPTGTGKTTTVAKLAARYAQKYGAEQVALVTIDSYRIGAYEQLATYAKIIGCAVHKAHNSEALAERLFACRNKRLVLIDTAGFGQRDTRLINQLDTFSGDSCANIKKYLVMQASTQQQVLSGTIDAYRATELTGCILTKLDETYSLGGALSALIENGLPISYLTDGQKVPEDLKAANAKALVTCAAKLYKKYGLPHTSSHQMDTSAMVV